MYYWWYYQKMRYEQMRKTYSAQGWTLLIYYGILNAAVMIVMVAGGVAAALAGQDETAMMDSMMESSGWGYFLAIGVGLLWLLLWKKPAYFSHVIMKKEKPMKLSEFLACLSIFMSAQLVMLIVSIVTSMLMQSMGISHSDTASISMDSWSMFLYVGLGAPISEEILFRGVLLRSMEPYGKRFAIITSALLFGLFHGNLSQAPFAFLVGLVLGYVTVEHNIGWAMVLHMFNNLIVSDTLSRIGSYLMGDIGELLVWAVILCFSIAAIVILIVQRKKIRAYLRSQQDDPMCKKAFFSAPGIITILIVLGVLILITEVSAFIV